MSSAPLPSLDPFAKADVQTRQSSAIPIAWWWIAMVCLCGLIFSFNVRFRLPELLEHKVYTILWAAIPALILWGGLFFSLGRRKGWLLQSCSLVALYGACLIPNITEDAYNRWGYERQPYYLFGTSSGSAKNDTVLAADDADRDLFINVKETRNTDNNISQTPRTPQTPEALVSSLKTAAIHHQSPSTPIGRDTSAFTSDEPVLGNGESLSEQEHVEYVITPEEWSQKIRDLSRAFDDDFQQLSIQHILQPNWLKVEANHQRNPIIIEKAKATMAVYRAKLAVISERDLPAVIRYYNNLNSPVVMHISVKETSRNFITLLDSIWNWEFNVIAEIEAISEHLIKNKEYWRVQNDTLQFIRQQDIDFINERLARVDEYTAQQDQARAHFMRDK